MDKAPQPTPERAQPVCRHCNLPIRETHMGRWRNEWEHVDTGMSYCANHKEVAWPVASPLSESGATAAEFDEWFEVNGPSRANTTYRTREYIWDILRSTCQRAYDAGLLAASLKPEPTGAQGRADTAADGVALIQAERRRQVAVEGWTPEHDDAHQFGELAKRAAALAVAHTDVVVLDENDEEIFPWKKHPAPRSLVIAGALLAAEIDRLQRAAVSLTPSEPVSPKPQQKERAPQTACNCLTLQPTGPCSTYVHGAKPACAECDHSEACHRAHWGAQSVSESPLPQPEKCEHCGQPLNNGWRHGYTTGYGDFATLSCSAESPLPVQEPQVKSLYKIHASVASPELPVRPREEFEKVERRTVGYWDDKLGAHVTLTAVPEFHYDRLLAAYRALKPSTPSPLVSHAAACSAVSDKLYGRLEPIAPPKAATEE